MVFAVSLSLVNLILYCVQQLGVTLGVGAETVLLVAYLQSMRDGVVDDKEKGFARAVRRVMDFGLFFIIISGIGVVATSYLGGSQALFSTIFLFKWSLIGIVLFMSLANRGSSLTAGLLQGLSAGTWYALFVVHILAPDAGWIQLGVFYAVWLVGFALCWTLVVFALRGKKQINPMSAALSNALPKPAVVIMPNKFVPPTQIAPPPAPPAKKVPPPIPPPKPAPVVVSIPVPPPPAPVKMPVPPPSPTVVLPMPVPPVAKIPSPDAPMPPMPPAPPPVAPTQAAPLIGLHVMPRTVEELEQRKASMRS